MWEITEKGAGQFLESVDLEICYEIVALLISEVVPRISHRHEYPDMRGTKVMSMNTPNWIKKSPQDLNTTQGIIGSWGKLGIREVSLPKKQHSNWFSSAKRSSLKTCTQISSLYRLNRLNLVIYMKKLWMKWQLAKRRPSMWRTARACTREVLEEGKGRNKI